MPTNPKSQNKSPKNNRKTPETQKLETILTKIKSEWRIITASFVIGLMLMAIVFVLVSSYLTYSQILKEREKRAEFLDTAKRWEEVLEKYPDYRDGHYTLALLYYQLDDNKRSLFHIERSLEIDPNFQKGKDFKLNTLGE